MEQAREVSPAEQRVVNREHEQWLALPITKGFIRLLADKAKPNPPQFFCTDSIAVYQALAIAQGAYQELVDIMQTPPYPNVEAEGTQQNVFDFNADDEDVN